MLENENESISSLIEKLQDQEISRGEFLRLMTLLGVSVSAAKFLVACTDRQKDRLLGDPMEYVYEVEYITTTPERPTDTPHALGEEKEGTPTSTPEPQIIRWYCSSCGKTFRTLQDYQKHAGKEHAWRLPDTKQVEAPTYAQYLTEDIGPFSERNTVFSRTLWDEEYQAKVEEHRAKAPDPNREAIEGQALVAGAIYVDATAGALHPNYYGYMGHVHGAGGLYGWDDPVSDVKYRVSSKEKMAHRIKEAARFYGANLVGITRVDDKWVYSPYFERATGESGENNIDHKFAIVMGIEMDWKRINTSPDKEASAATALAYSQMAELSSSLAKYIRSLGYRAIPCGNDTAQSIPLAIDAGLGELGRNGLLLTPEYGPRQRICKVFTELPLVPDKPVDFGLQDFCETCHACAAACPADAIRFEERTTERTSISNRPGIRRWPVNVSQCYLFWQENGSDCSNCIAACPWALHSQRDWLED